MRAILAMIVLASTVAAAEKNELPKEWHGTWKGTLKLPGSKMDEVPMVLVVAPLKDSPRLSFQITYGKDSTKSVRNYELMPGEGVGRFQIDEKNSIVLDAFLQDGVLHSQFLVDDKLLAARYELDGDTLKYEVTSAQKPTKPDVTGGEKGMPKVSTFQITNVQTAKLKRQP